MIDVMMHFKEVEMKCGKIYEESEKIEIKLKPKMQRGVFSVHIAGQQRSL